jgi:hypothetical protein
MPKELNLARQPFRQQRNQQILRLEPGCFRSRELERPGKLLNPAAGMVLHDIDEHSFGFCAIVGGWHLGIS